MTTFSLHKRARRGLNGSGRFLAHQAEQAAEYLSRRIAKAPVGSLALAAAGGFLCGWLVYSLLVPARRSPRRKVLELDR
jgi:hypothetical protein